MGDTSAVKVLKSVALIGTKGLKAKGVWRILGIQELIDTSRKMQGAMCWRVMSRERYVACMEEMEDTGAVLSPEGWNL